MRPTLVESGAAALAELERARGAGEVYGLILLDAMMPEMDGFTLAERMASQPGLSGATIMIQIFWQMPEEASQGLPPHNHTVIASIFL